MGLPFPPLTKTRTYWVHTLLLHHHMSAPSLRLDHDHDCLGWIPHKWRVSRSPLSQCSVECLLHPRELQGSLVFGKETNGQGTRRGLVYLFGSVAQWSQVGEMLPTKGGLRERPLVGRRGKRDHKAMPSLWKTYRFLSFHHSTYWPNSVLSGSPLTLEELILFHMEWQLWIHVPLVINSMISGKSFNLSQSQFPPLQTLVTKSTYIQN